ncbi:MAG: NADH-quinone oxidoreductase subunit C [Candidatus Omnitrophica bacterium]|nr:NADH-quinone oxidoreductase subunit C [Candidatus Omnitrophota bacterium]
MMIDELLNKIQGRFGQDILNLYKKNDKRAYIDIYPKDIVAMTRYLFKDLGLRFNIASAVDDFDGLEVLYHFSLDRSGVVVSVRVILKDKLNPAIDTITKVTRSAWWIEREMHELFGINFNDNEDLRPLLLSDDWPKGVYPMRKDFIAQKRDSRKV